jgi:conjugative transfer signal peptidase TraF
MVLTAGVLGLVALGLGLRVNLTESFPRGLYQAVGDARDFRLGELVCFDAMHPAAPRAARNYLGDDMPMLKRVAATSGMLVERDADGTLRVDGKALPCSRVFAQDSRGTSLPKVAFPLVVPPGSVWLSSEHPKGFDSRYYGPVPVQTLRCGHVRAVLTWGGGKKC